MPSLTSHDAPIALARRNLTLCHVSAETVDILLPYMEVVIIPQGMLLGEVGEPIRWVYFLTRGMASITNADAQGTAVELGVIGREGIIGYQALLGNFSMQNTMTMPFAGQGLRVPASLVKNLLGSQPEFLRGLHRFIYALLEQTSRLVLCNRVHDLESRLARWLLVTSDCLESMHLQLTQEFLADVLGTARPGVTIAAGSLQKKGAITYSRGRVEIRNRELLRASACDCYAAIRSIYHALYPELY